MTAYRTEQISATYGDSVKDQYIYNGKQKIPLQTKVIYNANSHVFWWTSPR